MTDINIRYVETENIRPAPWKATYIFRPDLKMLQKNIENIGIRYPILVRDEDSTIIDGHSRWLIAQKDKHLSKHFPVSFVTCSVADAMVLHIQMNRGRGQLIARDLSDLINLILDEAVYDDDEIRLMLGMTIDEFEVLVDGSLIKRKKLSEHKYNKAWVPIETKGPTETIKIERPETPDR